MVPQMEVNLVVNLPGVEGIAFWVGVGNRRDGRAAAGHGRMEKSIMVPKRKKKIASSAKTVIKISWSPVGSSY
jgi:hypothetical protein